MKRLMAALMSTTISIAVMALLPQPAHAALTVSSTKCASLVVIGARGSGQSWGSGSVPGFGPEVSGIARNAISRVKATGSVRYVGVQYPAIPVDRYWTRRRYFDSVGAGARYTMSVVNTLARDCTRTKFVLAGYSQGASVMRWALRDMPDSRKDRVVAAGFIADPERRGYNVSPSEIGLQENYASGTLYGSGFLGAGPALPSRRAKAIVSMCHKNDNVCNNPVNNGWAVGDWGRLDGSRQITHTTFYRSSRGIDRSGLVLYIPLANHGFR